MPRLPSFAFMALCISAAIPASAANFSLDFIGQQIIASGTQTLGTTLGGLSGIDYDPSSGNYIAISDDRSQINPARFYTLDLSLTASSFSGVNFSKVTTLKQPDGTSYPALSIDPESIRRLPNGGILYSSEGDKNNNVNAFIRAGAADGSYAADYALPSIFQQTGPAGTTGVRNNLAFESLTISPDGKTITTATENALIQDGAAAAFGIGSPSRILTYDLATGTAGAQYVYQVSPVAQNTTPPGQFATNGLVELVDIGDGQYLALERSFVTGLVTPTSATGNSIQLYLVDTNGATDVASLASLTGQSFTPVTKTLLFDLDSLGIPLDNIEGITFGQTLDNGDRSLILVSDNNFSGTQFTQLLAFDVKPNAVPEPASWALLIAGFGMIGAAGRKQTRRKAPIG